MIINLETGHSGKGYSFLSAYGGCPLKATLYAKRDEEHSHDETSPMGGGAAEGTGLHALTAAHYSGALNDITPFPSFQPVLTQEAHEEVERVWRAYSPHLPVFKHVIGVEDDIGSAEAASYLGLEEISARADLIAEIDDETLAQMFPTTFPPPAGRYIIDHKFLSQKPSLLKYESSHQLSLYQILWNIKHPEAPVLGGIVHCVVKVKKPYGVFIFVPPPSEADITNLRSTLQFWDTVRKTLPMQANPTDDNCFSWGRKCKFMGNECPRGSDNYLVQIGKGPTP